MLPELTLPYFSLEPITAAQGERQYCPALALASMLHHSTDAGGGAPAQGH